MNIQQIPWGVTKDGKKAMRYLLKNRTGMEVELSDFGALLLAIRLPLGEEKRDIALGFERLEEYSSNGPAFGAYIGRNANRIAGAKVVLNGKCYALEPNDRGNNLHSGSKRSHYECYVAESGLREEDVFVEFRRLSPHLEQGFPGNLHQRIRYTLTRSNALVIDYFMTADQDTVVNPTNHCYFNLLGHSAGDILQHKLQVFADFYLPTDEALIPTGEIASVEGTPMDFREPGEIGAGLQADFQSLRLAGGYDHNYCLRNGGLLCRAARLQAPDDSVSMTVFTDRPGLQVYTGNFLAGEKGKNGVSYHKNAGICFESQAYPNACGSENFPTSIQKADREFHSRTVYQFEF